MILYFVFLLTLLRPVHVLAGPQDAPPAKTEEPCKPGPAQPPPPPQPVCDYPYPVYVGPQPCHPVIVPPLPPNGKTN